MSELIIGALGVLATVIGSIAGWRLSRRAELGLSEWLRDLRAWSSDAIEILTQAAFMRTSSEPEADVAECRALACRLSSLVDYGRFFLPNQRRDEHGLDKPVAFRGYRHSALDPLVAAIRVLKTTMELDRRHDILVELKREFVSEIFQILEPESHNREVARLIQSNYRERSRDKTAGGLLPGEDIPRGAHGLLMEIEARITRRRIDSREP